MTQRHPGTFVTGAIFTVLGFAYLLQEFDVWSISLRYFFPILVILVGVAVALTGLRGRHDDGSVAKG